jgi:hypothetical protein
MSDTLTSDQKIEEKIEEAKDEIRNGVDNIKEAIEKALEKISFQAIGEDIAKSMGEIPIPIGTPGLPLVMEKTALEMLGGKEKLESMGLTETQISERVIEMIANIGFISLSLASIANANLIPAPPSIAVAKKYFDIVNRLAVFAEDELKRSEQANSTSRVNQAVSIL